MSKIRIISIIIVLSFILLAIPHGPTVQAGAVDNDSWGYRVVFDRSHGQFYSVYDTGFSGYSRLAILMRENGFRVQETVRPLQETLADLTDRDIIFLGVAKNAAYSETEIEAVRNYIEQGGNAIIVAEHDNIDDMAAFQNAIISDLGLEFRYDVIEERMDGRYFFGPEDQGAYGDGSVWQFAEGAGPLVGLKDVPIYSAASIQITGDAIPLLVASNKASPAGGISAALATYGKGKVICLGDSEVFWNGDEALSIEYKNASRFALEVLNLLVERKDVRIDTDYDLVTAETLGIEASVTGNFTEISLKGYGVEVDTEVINSPGTYEIGVNIINDGFLDFVCDGVPIKRIRFLKPTSGSMPHFTVLIDERGYARGADGAPDSLLGMARIMRDSGAEVFASSRAQDRAFDSYIIVNPLEMVEQDWVGTGKRGLVAADFYTVMPYNRPWTSFIRAGYENPEIPVMHLFESVNASLTERLVCRPDRYENPFYLRGAHSFGFDFPVFNAVGISVSKGQVLAAGESGSWAEYYDFFWHELAKDPEDGSNTTLLACSDNTLLLGSAESITTQFSDDEGWLYLAESITDWLAFRYIKHGNGVELLTTERGSMITTADQPEKTVALDNGRGWISIPPGSGEVKILVEYDYGNNITGAYNEQVETTATYTQVAIYSMSAVLMAAVAGTILWFPRRKRGE